MGERVAIITGAASGIGWAVARRAARRGFRVVLAARRADRLNMLAARIAQDGGQALPVPTDVADLAAQERLVEATLRAYGRIDVLFNNAGLPLPGPFREVSAAELRQQWDVNVTAVATLTRLALPALEQQGGVVVNVGSALTRIAMPGIGNYSPNKIAVTALSAALRRELVPHGVQVCLVEPGPVRTEFHAQARRRQILPARFILSPAALAVPIVRLFEHPRARIIVPGYLGPVLLVMEAAGRLLPGLADFLAAQHGRRGQLDS